tara:strand:+ start:834 stop:1067 length:234 start_codon:yes stop_codon:yes gene_type:complete
MAFSKQKLMSIGFLLATLIITLTIGSLVFTPPGNSVISEGNCNRKHEGMENNEITKMKQHMKELNNHIKKAPQHAKM